MSDPSVSTGQLPEAVDHQVELHEPDQQQAAPQPRPTTLDLDGVERDLADVELALARLDAGTYWTDEVTGASIPDEVLAERPTARRSGGH